MKILHTSDWHIGNTFFGNDRSDEHRAFFDFLCNTIVAEHPDALVVAGDVFDTSNPSAEAQALYYDFLHRSMRANPGMQTIVIAGNHDSAGRLEAPAPILEAEGIFVRGSVHRDNDGKPELEQLMIPLHAIGNENDAAVCLAVPFMRSYELPESKSFADGMSKFFTTLASEARKRYGKHMPLFLAAHFYATGSEIAADDHSERIIMGGEESVDVSGFCRKFNYVALGHIHKSQSVGGMEYVRYAGSALPMSFAEKHYHHGVELIETTNEGDLTITKIPFVPPHALVSIPERGTARCDEALAAIDALPATGKHSDRATFPYVEIKVDASEADPAIPVKIREHFEGKAAILCSIKRVETLQTNYKEIEVRTSEELKRLTPRSVAQTIYKKRFGGEDMPVRLLELLDQAEEQAAKAIEEQ